MSTDPKAANRAKFELELEFVQALANPYYLHSLAQQGIYARFIHYPHALHHLDLLQDPGFRLLMKTDDGFRMLNQKQSQHWMTWRDPKRVNSSAGEPSTGSPNTTAAAGS